MKKKYRTLLGAVLSLFACIMLVNKAVPLTVVKINLEEMTARSNLVIYGTVVSAHSQWEGKSA